VIDLDAYFARVGYAGPATATLQTLRALHALHPAAIPFEALDVLTGRGIDLAPEAIAAKLVRGRRGGYCFEQNGLFRQVLEALGFAVEPLIGRVVWLAPPNAPIPPLTHMALRVTIDGERWLADVGFGGRVLTDPLRFDTEAPQDTAHERFRLAHVPAGRRLEVEVETGWAAAYVLGGEPAADMDYVLGNWFTSTHPSSRFRNGLIVARTTAEARFALADGRFTTRRANGATVVEQLDAAGLERVLGEVFALPVQPEWRPILERAAAAGHGI
jgi:N-hydroxyarylamine O-acetyltransferase